MIFADNESLGLELRAEQPGDLSAIHDLIREAFGRELEADLVDKLRASAAFIPELSLVAVHDEHIVGHVMITTLEIATDRGERLPTTILAPLAVLPAFQNRGIGSVLTREILEKTRDAGHGSMILVGHPNYYPRFGFQPASTWGIRYSTAIRDDVFMAIELVPGALRDAAGEVTLPPMFDEA